MRVHFDHSATMTSRVSALLTATLLGTTTLVSAQESPAHFSWPSRATIKVTEKGLKRGHTSDLRYDIVCSRDETGALRISLKSLQFDKLDGEPIPAGVTEQLKPAIKAFEDMPAFLVDGSGRLTDIADMEKLMKVTEELSRSQGQTIDPKLFRDSNTVALLKGALANYWQSWVELWIDFPAKPGAPISRTSEQELIPGQPAVRSTQKMEFLGTIPGSPTLHHLRVEIDMSDPSMTSALGGLMQKFDQANGKPLNKELAQLPKIKGSKIYEVKIDPQTLRPVWARREIRFESTDSPSPAFPPQLETHEYRFDWPATATGPVSK